VTLRADAQRNLDRVLEAAGECFAEQGVDVSIDEIATRAGVGHGTVFRRFPTKDALLAAVLASHIADMAVSVEAACDEPDAGEAFERVVRGLAESYAQNHALVEAMKRCESAPEIDALVGALGRLLEHAQDAGAVRKDVGAVDVLSLVPAASAYPQIVLDGLRTPAA
jgi:AcrR family transcriptional regulator